MVFSDNTSRKAPTSPSTAPMISTPSQPRSTADPERPSAGKRPPKPSTITYSQSKQAVLQRLLEPEQYTSIRFSERLAAAGIQPSVGAVGSSYDKGLAS
jgi:transposase InsO family protein